MRFCYVVYALKQPRRALDYILKERRVAKLCICSVREVRKYFDELNKLQLLAMLETELKRFNFSLGATLTPLRGPVIYAVVRALKPSIVVETGVASGVSTALTLQALSLNWEGELYSVDMPNLDPLARLPSGKEPGWLVPRDLRKKWHFVLGLSREKLGPLLQKLGSIDLFLHDSEHSYRNMLFEFELAWFFLREGGVLLAGDVTTNNAFRDFVRMKKPAYWTTFGGLGACRK